MKLKKKEDQNSQCLELRRKEGPSRDCPTQEFTP
ncbi:hypothetical protein T11_1817 [Trichinella zimbabwensis]|uniref:Uncharacterized protein n=1 Tax=Trichinella zimbabwensis TaxID=268475 RepID=A0A0V1G6I9_9BILA|nr:hypothetical protein T11_1817 [Trichinella zimbabwensis]